jgi:hypothetical protein
MKTIAQEAIFLNEYHIFGLKLFFYSKILWSLRITVKFRNSIETIFLEKSVVCSPTVRVKPRHSPHK